MPKPDPAAPGNAPACPAPGSAASAGTPSTPGPHFRLPLRASRLDVRLFLIVFVALLPLTLMVVALLLQDARGERERMLDSAQNMSNAVMTAIESDLDISLAALDALVSSPRLAKGDLQAFHAEMVELLERRGNWANVVLASPEAAQLANAKLRYGAPLPAQIDPESVRRVVETGRPYVGNMVYSPIFKSHMFGVFQPVVHDGRVRYVLAAAIQPASIGQLLRSQQLNYGQVISIVDRNNRVVARTLHNEARVGQQVSPALQHLLDQNRGSGNLAGTTRTTEGVDVYTNVSLSAKTGWSVAHGLPVESVEGPARRALLALAVAAALSIMLGLLVAAAIARTITAPIEQLRQAAENLGSGQAPLLPATSLPEIAQLGQALQSAHEEREKRLQSEREARQFEHEARQVAENANRAKDEFLAMLSHELRNPLAAISAASQILDITKTLGPEALPPSQVEDDARAIIRRQVAHLAKLTDDLLDAGRIVLGKVQLEREEVELAGLVECVLDTVRRTRTLDGVQFVVRCQPAWAMVDRTRIEQVVDNLLGNAIKYAPPPCTVTVEVNREGGDAVIRIADTGIGMDADLQQRVFDLFVQGERSLDRAQGGLGIGLTLVRRLVELQGGTVSAASAGPGLGSTFTVRLPAIDAPSTGSPGPSSHPRSALSIALVEDNSDLRASMRQLLEYQGHRVIEAADGKSGVDLILSGAVDTALVDIGLPFLDGFGVARAVCAHARPRPKLIAMTGYGDQNTMEQARLAGFDAVLAKPVELGKLLALLPANGNSATDAA